MIAFMQESKLIQIQMVINGPMRAKSEMSANGGLINKTNFIKMILTGFEAEQVDKFCVFSLELTSWRNISSFQNYFKRVS